MTVDPSVNAAADSATARAVAVIREEIAQVVGGIDAHRDDVRRAEVIAAAQLLTGERSMTLDRALARLNNFDTLCG